MLTCETEGPTAQDADPTIIKLSVYKGFASVSLYSFFYILTNDTGFQIMNNIVSSYFLLFSQSKCTFSYFYKKIKIFENPHPPLYYVAHRQ